MMQRKGGSQTRRKTILVTGGAGFIGGNFVLTDAPPESSGRQPDALTYAGNLDTLTASRTNPTMVHPGIHRRPQPVDYLLERHSRTSSPTSPRKATSTGPSTRRSLHPDQHTRYVPTTRGSSPLLALALSRGAQSVSFLHVSTDEVYGTLGSEGYFTEEPLSSEFALLGVQSLIRPLGQAYFHTYGMPTLTTNCSNNYGPYQFPEKLIPLMIHNAINGKPLPVYGTGANVRDWLYVEDHCRALERVIEEGKPGEVYNIGGNNEKTNLEVVETICSLLDELLPNSKFRPHRKLITFVADRPGHDFRYAIDASKIRRELGWEPHETFETGLRKTVQWYLENQTWSQRVMDGSYRGERLGIERS